MRKKDKKIKILQCETHNDDLGIVFLEKDGEVFCAIDWQGGEMKFKLNFNHPLNTKNKNKMKRKLPDFIVPGHANTPVFDCVKGEPAELTKKEIEFITDDTCKYGHLTGWSTPNNCHQCIDCGKLFPEDNERKGLISELTHHLNIKNKQDKKMKVICVVCHKFCEKEKTLRSGQKKNTCLKCRKERYRQRYYEKKSLQNK